MDSGLAAARRPGMTEVRERRSARTCQGLVKVDPVGIRPLDQIDLPLTAPLLELLLARDRVHGIVVAFEPDEKVHSMSRSESGNGVRSMLVHPTDQISGHADVERAVFAACKDVDVHDGRPLVMDSGLRPPKAVGPGMTPSIRDSELLDPAAPVGLRHVDAAL